MTAPSGRVLVVDDEELIRTLILRHLAGRGLAVEYATDGRHAFALASTGAFDVVISDIEMEGLDGITLARDVARTAPTVPVVLLSGKASLDHAVRAMRYGVCDLILKPFHLDALDESVDRALKRRRALREAEEYRRVLQKRIEELSAAVTPPAPAAASAVGDRERTGEVALGAPRARVTAAELEALLTMIVEGVEARGAAPKGHGRRTRALAVDAARRTGMGEDDLANLGLAALYHDVGLTALPDPATWHAGVRAAEDEALHRQHPLAGAEMLRRATCLAPVAKLVEAHHEHFDGTGFPRGSRGETLSFSARLLAAAAAADEFLAADPARGRPELEEFLRVDAGTRFAPDAVEALLGVPSEELDQIYADRAAETPPVAV